jgi:hypothetical protein
MEHHEEHGASPLAWSAGRRLLAAAALLLPLWLAVAWALGGGR